MNQDFGDNQLLGGPAMALAMQTITALRAKNHQLRAALVVAKDEIVSWNEEIGYHPDDLLDDPAMQQIDAALKQD